MNPDSSTLASLALLITAIVGFFAYRNTKNISGATTAIDGLDKLAERHGQEIERLEKQHHDYFIVCEDFKASATKTVANLEGQISVLKQSVFSQELASEARNQNLINAVDKIPTQIKDTAKKTEKDKNIKPQDVIEQNNK